MIGASGLLALGLLLVAVLAQRGNGGVVQDDDPLAVRGLGRGDGQVAVVFLQLPDI